LDLGFLHWDRATNVFPHHASSAFSEATRYEVLLAFSGGIWVIVSSVHGRIASWQFLYFAGRCIQTD
jgi:hypothetical protein